MALARALRTSADRRIDHLGTDADDEPAEEIGIDAEIHRDVAADALAQRLFQRVDLIVGQRVRRGDLGIGLAAVRGCELAETRG